MLTVEILAKEYNADNWHRFSQDFQEAELKVDNIPQDIVNALVKTPRLVFNKLFKLGENPKEEIVTAFSGVLELSRQNEIDTEQKELFGDIVIEKHKKKKA